MIGVLVGLLEAVKANVVLGLLVELGVNVLGWVLIRVFEDAIYKAGDAAEDAIRKKLNERKNKKRGNLSSKVRPCCCH